MALQDRHLRLDCVSGRVTEMEAPIERAVERGWAALRSIFSTALLHQCSSWRWTTSHVRQGDWLSWPQGPPRSGALCAPQGLARRRGGGVATLEKMSQKNRSKREVHACCCPMGHLVLWCRCACNAGIGERCCKKVLRSSRGMTSRGSSRCGRDKAMISNSTLPQCAKPDR